MPASSLSYFIIATLTLKDRATAATSTWRLSNRAILSASASNTYYPILKEVGAIGSRMNGPVPQVQQGSLIIDNSADGIGYERRFTDLLERYEFVNQPVELSFIAAPPGFDDPGSAPAMFTANMLRGSINAKAQTFTIDIEASTIERKVLTRIVSPVTETSAPDSAFGFALPIVLGAGVEVKGVCIDDDATPVYAYATTLSNDHPVGGINTIYARNRSGGYSAVNSAAAIGTTVWQNSSAASATYTIPGTNIAAYCVDLGVVTGNEYVITSLDIEGDGMSNGSLSVTGTIKAEIWEGDTTKPLTKIAEGTVNGSTYQSSFRGASDFWINLSLSEAWVVDNTKRYYIAIRYDKGGGDAVRFTANGSALAYTEISSGGGWNNYGAYLYKPRFRFYGLRFVDITSTSGKEMSGLGYASVEVSQTSTITDISKLEYVFNIDGLLDDAAGSITGTHDALITSPADALYCLSQSWNGSAWVSPAYSKTNLPLTGITTYPRAVGGRTDGENTLADITRQVCQEHALRVAMLNAATPLSLYAWGSRVESTATLTDDDCTISRAFWGGVDSVINHAEIYYNRKLSAQTFDVARANEYQSNYAGAIDWYYGANAMATSLTAASHALFPDSPAGRTNYDWFNTQASAQAMAQYLLRIYEFPTFWIELECSLFDYSGIDLFDVITVLSPDLPAFMGTSPAAKKATYAGSEADLLRGNYARRAQPYRIQVEARDIVLRERVSYPILRLLGRAIINKNDPT